MKNLLLVFVVAFAFSTMAMASDIAISTQANWWSQGAADREMQEIADNVTGASVEQFGVNEQDALAVWVADHTGNGTVDLLILCGTFPDTIYTPGNTQADDSLAELFLDDGNTIIGTGDYIFYVVNGAGTNATGGLETMMDIAGITMWDDDTPVVVTAEAQDYTPTLQDFASDRPFHLNELDGDWEPELILAQNDAGTRADPVIVVNTATGGRIGIFYQTASQDDDPRGEVISEWINNWFLTFVAAGNPYARSPSPKDGAMHADTWISISWSAGDFAASHDVYFGDNFDDVNDGTRDSDVFRGNQGLDTAFYIAGFAGYAYEDGLVPGTTYYWRIDEVNDANAASPWKGNVWSFWIPPKTAYSPEPADGAELVDLNVGLSWTAGFGSKLHYIVFGEDFDEVSNAAAGTPNGTTTYNPGPLKLAKTYYWRVDEFEGPATHKGEVWSFTTLGAVSGPNPADGAVDVKPSVILTWNAGAVAASHEVYFGTDADAVKNATTASPEYKGPKALGEESLDPGILTLNTAYFWRIDEVNGVNPDSPWAGNVWSFTTGDFFVIDDIEDYDAMANQIWFSWHDGLGAGAPGTPGYIPGNGTGSAVGDETTLSYTEETIVHGGSQSMPVSYDNNQQGFSKYSETELTLTDQRNWSEQGVTELSLWFRGNPGSTGSFVEAPVGTYTMTASGADIWTVNGVEADEFHFAYKMLTGAGSMVARVDSIQNTNAWAKAGVMIRETLDPDSAHAFMVVTPAQGVSFQRRPGTGATSTSDNSTTGDEVAPHWVKIDRTISGSFTASHSTNGTTWVTLGTTQTISMAANVYVGLALTSHDAALTCEAVFSNITTTGTVSGQWAHQDIGITSNDAEPLYVAISNSAGNPAVVVHDDPAASQIDTWTEWVIPLQALADQGIVLTNVDRIAIGLGTQGNMTIPGGSGKMFFDDIRLYRPREAAE